MGILVVMSMLVFVLTVGYRFRILAPVAVTVVLQALLAILFFQYVGLSGDAFTYDESAQQLASFWNGEGDRGRIAADGKQSVVVLAAVLYWLGPIHPLLPMLFLAVVQGLLPIALSVSVINFGFPASARTAAWLAALVPQVVLWSPWLRREGISFLLLSGIVLSLSMMYRAHWLPGASLSVATVSLIWWSRPQLILVWAAGSLLTAVSHIGRRRLNKNAYSVRRTLAAPILLMGASFIVAGVALAVTSTGEVLSEDRVEQIVQSNSSPSQGLAVYSPEELARGPQTELIPRATSALLVFGPWPTEWDTTSRIIVGIDGIVLLVTYVVVIALAAWKPAARWMIVILLGATSPLFVGILVTLANWGIVARVRAHILVLLIPGLAVSLHLIWTKARRGRAQI